MYKNTTLSTSSFYHTILVTTSNIGRTKIRTSIKYNFVNLVLRACYTVCIATPVLIIVDVLPLIVISQL